MTATPLRPSLVFSFVSVYVHRGSITKTVPLLEPPGHTQASNHASIKQARQSSTTPFSPLLLISASCLARLAGLPSCAALLATVPRPPSCLSLFPPPSRGSRDARDACQQAFPCPVRPRSSASDSVPLPMLDGRLQDETKWQKPPLAAPPRRCIGPPRK
ncbi:hypothetical protein HDV57DRAFT_2061 [Trichoderma longibrachiatum]|uniref:Uncharacterized protein n=1 Tax=Trichoderma longibrachiatum ATCC 18648 TaxID=983965 RepID=A0A2T4CK05_TRILO|nr:hypothetical protein M440DRAFT_1026222 [Trichoderma longibrachiatum ATCC 18648]